MRKAIHALAIVGILIGIAWAFVDFGFGSVATATGALIAFLTRFERKEGLPGAAPVVDSLSENAQRVLSEIDGSDESDPKGVSLMMMGSSVGFYRPFIWDNHLHGEISGHEGFDPSGVISAVDELVDSDYLIPHYEGDSLLQWRRTRKAQS